MTDPNPKLHHANRLQVVAPERHPYVRRQSMPAGFHPDTSAAAFQPKSTFAFTLWVRPDMLQDTFYLLIG
jgi:hypothetical protein